MDLKKFTQSQIKLKISFICYKSGVNSNQIIEYIYQKVIVALENGVSHNKIFEILYNNGILQNDLLSELIPHLDKYSEIIQPEIEATKRQELQKKYAVSATQNEKRKTKREKNINQVIIALFVLAVIIVIIVFYKDIISKYWVLMSLSVTVLSIIIGLNKFFKQR
jgi:predicted RND superfamily exporter protein